MKNILISWIGRTDLRAVTESETNGLGPLAQAVRGHSFDEVVLLCDYPVAEAELFIAWLSTHKQLPVTLKPVTLSGPTDFADIYEAAVRVIRETLSRFGQESRLTFHLSPGTPAMAAVWILLAKTLFPATLIESSREHGVKLADVPFDISAEFIPALLRRSDERLEQLAAGLPPEAPEFADIIYRSPDMQRIVARARLVAPRTIPVLIEGESGTGKELFARAIHRASLRRDGPFIAVNCGAIPAELIESEFFGHKKGAFTGAIADRKGAFESATGGTLFLEEIGELPPAAQVKILRALQEGEVVRVGETTPVVVDVRIVAATNRSLIQEVADGRFRADLFYRLAVAVLRIPPLRERQGDIGLLIDHFIAAGEDRHKKLSIGARNLLLAHPWPGNVRELVNTLRRATLWATGDTVTAEDIKESLFPSPQRPENVTSDRSLAEGFSLPDHLAEIARQYLEQAMKECGGNKSKAAKLLGLPNYQTLTNWLKRHGVE
jgi:DNA-binding NtrC family response regulator